MTSLTTWLLERIADDEAVARAATPGPWRWRLDDEGACDGLDSDARDTSVIWAHGEHTQGWLVVEDADANHIARHDPARVLAECASKRRIVELHPINAHLEDCETCFSGDYDRLGDPERETYPCPTLRALVSMYAGADGFREEWA